MKKTLVARASSFVRIQSASACHASSHMEITNDGFPSRTVCRSLAARGLGLRLAADRDVQQERDHPIESPTGFATHRQYPGKAEERAGHGA